LREVIYNIREINAILYNFAIKNLFSDFGGISERFLDGHQPLSAAADPHTIIVTSVPGKNERLQKKRNPATITQLVFKKMAQIIINE
jgi:hypothetical protein